MSLLYNKRKRSNVRDQLQIYDNNAIYTNCTKILDIHHRQIIKKKFLMESMLLLKICRHKICVQRTNFE